MDRLFHIEQEVTSQFNVSCSFKVIISVFGSGSVDVSAPVKLPPSGAPCWALRLRDAQVGINIYNVY